MNLGISTLAQFTCVALAERGVLIAGRPGSGKSSLALALIDRGAVLVGDDGVTLTSLNGALRAAPAPATRGLLEVRNVGLFTLPVAQGVPVCLLLCLSHDAPRYLDAAPLEAVAGVPLPAVTLWPDSPALALRAEWALARYGLRA